jgi:RNA polymerase sigma factor for flagellar operon FliA
MKGDPPAPDIASAWRQYKATKDPQAKERIVHHYLHLVKYIADRLRVHFPPQVQVDDLVSSGIIGLLDAIEKFDLARGLKFETYAMARIRGAIIDELRNLDWAPRSMRKKEHELEDAYTKLERALGRTATDDEVARELAIDVEELHGLFAQINTAVFMSLDDLVTMGDNDADTTRRLNLIKSHDRHHPDMQVHLRQVRELLGRAIDTLPAKVKQMVALYYYEDLNLKEIGRVLGISESRVCQLHSQAMLLLRQKLKSHKHELLASYT